MIYHRYVITLQLWYNKQSNYMSLWYITLDIVHPFFGLQHGLLSAPPALRRPRHWLTPGKSRLRSTARPFPKWQNGLAPAIPYWGTACHCPVFFGGSILCVMCNFSDSISLSPYSTPYPYLQRGLAVYLPGWRRVLDRSFNRDQPCWSWLISLSTPPQHTASLI